MRFYVSKYSASDDNAQVVGADVPFGALADGQSTTVHIQSKLPVGLSPATGLHVYALIDAASAVEETDKTNNTVGFGPLP